MASASTSSHPCRWCRAGLETKGTGEKHGSGRSSGRYGNADLPWRLLSLTLLTRRTAFWSTPMRSLLEPNSLFMYFSANKHKQLSVHVTRLPTTRPRPRTQRTCGGAHVLVRAAVGAADQRQVVGQDVLEELVPAQSAVPHVLPAEAQTLDRRSKRHGLIVTVTGRHITQTCRCVVLLWWRDVHQRSAVRLRNIDHLSAGIRKVSLAAPCLCC